MPKFLTGFAAGVATGMLFRDTIVHNFNRLVDFAEKKAEEQEAEQTKSYSDEATLSNPAAGTALPSMRIQEINDSSPDNPVVLTNADIDAMDVMYIKAHVKSGRFKLVDGSEA
jgi:CO dehydrogenase/acetyl-CoA synthase beta subunit